MKAVITGINGFIGSALNKRLLSMGWQTYQEMRPDVNYVFLFGSPSSNNWYSHALTYSIRETIDNFLNAVDFCQANKIKLVYPSSGTIYQAITPYSKCKFILDTLGGIYQSTLGLRIFAGYGSGEAHKTYYSSVVYSFIQEMKAGNSPVIWGDGKQVRDFIYIDDVVDNIIKYRDKEGTVDIGTGVGTSINEVVKLINKKLGTKIKPTYIDKPTLYIDDCVCQDACEYNITLEKGIERIINETTLG